MSVLVSSGPDEGLVWHHGDPVREQRAIASGHGAIRLPNRGLLRISGDDRLGWLHSLTSQHLGELAPGVSREALVLSPQGHAEHVLHLVDDGQHVWAWTEPGMVDELAGWLERMRFMMRVEVEVVTDHELLWVGSEVALPDDVVVRDSLVGNGREVFWPQGRELPTHAPVGTWALEAARIADGVPRIGIDTDHRTIPNEIGLFGTHLDKGCYRGQETVARVHTLGRPPRRLVLLHLDGSDDRLPASGSSIELDGRSIGFVGSAERHHELGPVALGLVKRNVPVEATVVIDGLAAAQETLVDPEVGMHVRPRLG